MKNIFYWFREWLNRTPPTKFYTTQELVADHFDGVELGDQKPEGFDDAAKA